MHRALFLFLRCTWLAILRGQLSNSERVDHCRRLCPTATRINRHCSRRTRRSCRHSASLQLPARYRRQPWPYAIPIAAYNDCGNYSGTAVLLINMLQNNVIHFVDSMQWPYTRIFNYAKTQSMSLCSRILTNLRNSFTTRKSTKFSTKFIAYNIVHNTLSMLLYYLHKLEVQMCCLKKCSSCGSFA